MSIPRWSDVFRCLIPALFITFVAITIAGVTGGIIAAAIVGLASVSALLTNSVFSFIFVSFFPNQSRLRLLLSGFALYIISVALALAFWSIFGPSQIM
jgi:hypothetical protein